MENDEAASRLSTKESNVPDLQSKGITATTDKEKADLLAEFFSSQCSAHDPNLPITVGAPYPFQLNHSSFVFPPISGAVVLSRLQHLPLHKVSSDRLMANRLLRETTSLIASSITYIFNLFLNISQFPDEWKVAIIFLLFEQYRMMLFAIILLKTS